MTLIHTKKFLATEKIISKVIDQDDFYDEYLDYLNEVTSSIKKFENSMVHVQIENNMKNDSEINKLLKELSAIKKQVSSIADKVFTTISKRFPQ